jgi:uncharacterized protein
MATSSRWRKPCSRGPHTTAADDRFDYRELREAAIGLINDRLFVCIYTGQEETQRVISLRKANQPEMGRYGENLEQGGA